MSGGIVLTPQEIFLSKSHTKGKNRFVYMSRIFFESGCRTRLTFSSVLLPHRDIPKDQHADHTEVKNETRYEHMENSEGQALGE